MISVVFFCVFFFKQKKAYEMRISDWCSDVCSSDLSHVRLMRMVLPGCIFLVFSEVVCSFHGLPLMVTVAPSAHSGMRKCSGKITFLDVLMVNRMYSSKG